MRRRVGQCNRCGKCCTTHGLLGDLAESAMKHLSWLKRQCPHLIFDNGKALCQMYLNRPDFCRAYPVEPNDLIDGCGFGFREV